MKDSTVHSLLIARTLLELASDLCDAEDRYVASAGNVVLQDAVEMLLYAVLVEKDIDEAKNIEGKSFDELIGEVKAANVLVPKSGTLKAMNRQRVLTKHFAQVAEPVTVRNYLDAAQVAITCITKEALGKPLCEFMITDLLNESEAKKSLIRSEELIEERNFLAALIEIRKAIFLEFENPYSVYGWRDFVPPSGNYFIDLVLRGGSKAPRWACSKEWADSNVRDPIDYIQIESDTWRMDLLEWGINTAEIANVRRLTPQVFQAKHGEPWYIKRCGGFDEAHATFDNCMYCLDRSVAMLLKKQFQSQKSKPTVGGIHCDPIQGYLGDNVYRKATTTSEVVHTISPNLLYEARDIVSGFDAEEEFLYIAGRPKEEQDMQNPAYWVSGFLLKK